MVSSRQSQCNMKMPLTAFDTASGDNSVEVEPSSKVSKRDVSPSRSRKKCTLCDKPRDVLVRCQIDESGAWHFLCPGKCWKSVSGGEVDAAGHEAEHPFYRYGGMWKNKHAGVSAKKPKKKASNGAVKEWKDGMELARNDRVQYEGKTWLVRRSHTADIATNNPDSESGYRYWKEADQPGWDAYG